MRIVQALERGDTAAAETLMAEHIGTVQSALRVTADPDPLAHLRDALAPLDRAAAGPAAKARDLRSARSPATRGRKAAGAPPSPDDDSSTYLGALL